MPQGFRCYRNSGEICTKKYLVFTAGLESNGKLLSIIKEFAIEISQEMLKISYSLTRFDTAGHLIYACLQGSMKVHHSTIVSVTKRKRERSDSVICKVPFSIRQ